MDIIVGQGLILSKTGDAVKIDMMRPNVDWYGRPIHYDEPKKVKMEKPEVKVSNHEPKSFNELGKEIYENNLEKGFYDNPTSFSERIALIHGELSEALEADRKDLMDDKLPHRTGREVELADAIIRILDCAVVYGMDIDGAVREKMAYNRTRPFRHGKKY